MKTLTLHNNNNNNCATSTNLNNMSINFSSNNPVRHLPELISTHLNFWSHFYLSTLFLAHLIISHFKHPHLTISKSQKKTHFHPIVLVVKEKHGPLEVCSAEKDVIEGLEVVEGDPLRLALELVRHHLDHLLLLLLRDGGGVEQVSAEVRLGDVVLGVLSVPEM